MKMRYNHTKCNQQNRIRQPKTIDEKKEDGENGVTGNDRVNNDQPVGRWIFLCAKFYALDKR